MRLALILVLAVAAAAAAPTAWAGSETTPAGHLVRWDDGLDHLGRRAAGQVPLVSSQVATALGFPLAGGPAEIVIVRGYERMRAELGGEVPDWAAGVFQGSRSRIVLRADRVDQSPLSSMITTLRHEWVHLAWSRRAGKRTRELPLWVEEGLAEDIGGGVSVEAGAQLDFAARFGWMLSFEEIAARWPDEAGKASLAYKQGRSWVRYFRASASGEVIQKILADLADGANRADGPGAGTHFEQLVLEHSGSSLSNWLATWEVHVKEQAAPWFHLLLRDFTGTMFFVIAVVGGVSFFFLRRRRKRQIAALPDHPMPGSP